MQSPPSDEYDLVSDEYPTRVILTSQVVLEQLDQLFEYTLPFVPCLDAPDLNFKARLPDSRRVWDIPEQSLMGQDDCLSSTNNTRALIQEDDEEPTVVWTGEGAFVQYDIPQIASTEFAHPEEDVKDEEIVSIPASSPGSSSHLNTEAPTPEESTESSSERQQNGSPPSSSISHNLEILIDIQERSYTPSRHRRGRRRGRRIHLGRALISARDRVPPETWVNGIEEMQDQEVDMSMFYRILSLGLEADGGVRDV